MSAKNNNSEKNSKDIKTFVYVCRLPNGLEYAHHSAEADLKELAIESMRMSGEKTFLKESMIKVEILEQIIDSCGSIRLKSIGFIDVQVPYTDDPILFEKKQDSFLASLPEEFRFTVKKYAKLPGASLEEVLKLTKQMAEDLACDIEQYRNGF